MKKQIIQVLWGIAQGQPQVQGEAVVYPNIREQLNAIKALMSIEGWEEEELPTRQSTPAEHPTMPCTPPHPIEQKQRPRRKKQLFIRGTSIPIN